MDIENRPEFDTMPVSPHNGFVVMLALRQAQGDNVIHGFLIRWKV
jgi:hypothetical protein